MTSKALQNEKGFDFAKRYKVSAWVSSVPYAEIPDDYFEERFSKNQTRASNCWSDNYKIRYFRPEFLETNGSQDATISLEKAAGECSFSSSFITNLMSKARKLKISEVTWLILLFEYEYSSKLSAVESDQYTQFLGAFNYDDDSDSVYELSE